MHLPITGSKLIGLIPQRPPFVFIDTLCRIDGNLAETSFTIQPDCVLCDNGKLNAGGLIENMAQTCAAKAGYDYTLANKVIPVGFIGDVRHFQCTRLPMVGEVLQTIIEIENEVFGVSIIAGKVSVNNEVIASCKMKIFVDESKTAESEVLTKTQSAA